ncbi:TPA: hypothetical protein DDW69_02340 [candidate division CPR2 bacterium]|uniref:Uncharacterized protein n=1 Tax=candidate division CPR2 bacterium GW2011_GWC1_41_48 TaxID=1618344 RepID=A0A0G0WA57_UNCC2|nr:MAG: hypothetical protein UT47_C0001G0270 [candidate division CPR2 bacterium GW2011_GWC2_39_35]KKR28876.1 MAG: hypothetical protein UT59_C0017G0010 [candidate division CPR2 bacterium GW2011_GWD1_39_7]KKR29151.1 MAG: hypothetical protein UT60_C0006G0014 [candidate division CPR2 bacterium GW2011_GWD2_39_7]KKS09865.1 MAG: hypothetical protein UU65_C0001G0270 [candidate division CPR2 bacterium GW2011_GWC1_41_48]OGB61504.1 MAG: hypothetical protein A2Y27_02520 [candidate division CPR2 bacterium G
MTIRKKAKNLNEKEKEILKKDRENDWELYRTSGGQEILEDLENPEVDINLYADDLDAGWKYDVETGEETISGTVLTPDKDQIDEIGKGIGLTYDVDEELDADKKIKWKEAQRWEPPEPEKEDR